MSISFNQISVDLLTPGTYVEYDSSRAVQTTPTMPNVVLLIGQRLSTGTVAAETPVSVPSAAKGEEYFGHGSILAHMIDAFKAANPYVELWAIALDDDAGGTAGTGTFAFSGTATEDGVVYAYIGGERVTTAVSSGDTAATIGTNLAAAVTAHVADSNLPISGAGAATVTITCLHKGTLGNNIDLALNHNTGESLPAGVSCVVTDVGDVVAGATDPDVADAIAAMGDGWYTTIISAYADDTNHDKLEAEALARWHPYEQKDVMLFIGALGTQSALTALGNARNNKFTCLMGGGLSPSPPWIWAAVGGAIDTSESDPARQRTNLQLTGLVAPKVSEEFTQTERGVLLTDGVSTFTVGADGNCYVEMLITTYQTNAAGVRDWSYFKVTTMRSLAYIRYAFRSRVQLRFPRHKLADDGTNFSPGQAITTPAIVRTELLALGSELESLGIIEGFDQYSQDMLVERNASNNDRLDIRIAPDLINQLLVTAAQVQFLL
ncbi:MAG: phage tail sheath C-terminal domain-containing protein [Phycisphaerales bacterium]|jgi:phage tail sheath gpL-like